MSQVQVPELERNACVNQTQREMSIKKAKQNEQTFSVQLTDSVKHQIFCEHLVFVQIRERVGKGGVGGVR